MYEEIEVLIDADAIEGKVAALAAQISRDYAGKDLVLVCILKGASIFTADLSRRLTMPVAIDFVSAASYGKATTSARRVLVKKDVEMDITGKHVLLVDGIVDTGETLHYLLDRLQERRPASLRVAVLLDKPSRRTVAVPIDYRGFEIPDRFVVGYGMDAAEKYRNLPYIAAIRT